MAFFVVTSYWERRYPTRYPFCSEVKTWQIQKWRDWEKKKRNKNFPLTVCPNGQWGKKFKDSAIGKWVPRYFGVLDDPAAAKSRFQSERVYWQTVTWNMGDFSRDGKVDSLDGKVDSLDLSIFIKSWQASIDSAGTGEEPGQTAIQFIPPTNASLGIATVPRHESLLPRRPIIPMLTATAATTNVASIDAVLAESVLAESDYTAIAKDLSAVSAKKSTVTSDRSFALGFDPYADLG